MRNVYSIALRVLSVLAVGALMLTACDQPQGGPIQALELDSVVLSESKVYQNRPSSEDAEARPYRVALDLEVSYVYPTNADSLCASLGEWILGVRRPDLPVDSLVRHYLRQEGQTLTEDLLLSSTTETGQAIEQEGMHHRLRSRLIGEGAQYASFVYELDTYAGGAHGLVQRSYRTFDKASGRPLLEGQLFVDGYEESLTEVLIEAMVQHFELQSREQLESEGILFSLEGITLSGNCAATPQGLIYCYNPYEIAPYSTGIITLTLPWKSLQAIIRPGSVAEQYIK